MPKKKDLGAPELGSHRRTPRSRSTHEEPKHKVERGREDRPDPTWAAKLPRDGSLIHGVTVQFPMQRGGLHQLIHVPQGPTWEAFSALSSLTFDRVAPVDQFGIPEHKHGGGIIPGDLFEALRFVATEVNLGPPLDMNPIVFRVLQHPTNDGHIVLLSLVMVSSGSAAYFGSTTQSGAMVSVFDIDVSPGARAAARRSGQALGDHAHWTLAPIPAPLPAGLFVFRTMTVETAMAELVRCNCQPD